MYIKYDNNVQQGILHLPEGQRWSLYYSFENEKGEEECSIYAVTEAGEKIMVLNGDDWIREYPSLQFHFQSLYEDLLTAVGKMLADNKIEPRFLDLPELEEKLIKENESVWIKKGYLTVDEDGNWQ
ncbi:MAG: hypothetical protein IJ043_09755 [Clostridia bacterium]|nr:hypothetical protein [Clostridia bacterium]